MCLQILSFPYVGHVLIIEVNTCSRFIVNSFESGRTTSSTILDSVRVCVRVCVCVCVCVSM